MQNNNSKLNTVLLIIVIILLAIGIWMLFVNDKVVDSIENQTEVVNDTSNEEVVVEKLAEEKSDPKEQNDTWLYPDFLKVFVYPIQNIVGTLIIESFPYEGETYYSVRHDENTDGKYTHYIYSTVGTLEASCTGFTTGDGMEMCSAYTANANNLGIVFSNECNGC